MARSTAVTAYYEALDAGEYDRLSALLTPGFVHHRPDRTLDGRDAFVSFMATDRPRTDTVHEIGRVFRPVDGAAKRVVRGRLLTREGECLFEFVDVFSFADGRIGSLETYTAH